MLRVLVRSMPKKTFSLRPGCTEAIAICFSAWSAATTTPVVAATRAQAATRGPTAATRRG